MKKKLASEKDSMKFTFASSYMEDGTKYIVKYESKEVQFFEVLQEFEVFLRKVGFEFTGHIDVVNDEDMEGKYGEA